jgi:pre-mRNA-splicing factor 38B
VLEDKRFRSNREDKETNISKSQVHGEHDTNSIHNINSFNNTLNPLLKPFKTHGDPVSCNLNTLIHNNILSNQYFKELFSSKGFNETLDEIIQNAKYAEPWTVGTNGIPSTLFCCLYRLMLCQLSEGQVKLLLNNEDSAYIRCAGFLYIRYLCDPKDLWTWFSPYILDEQGIYTILIRILSNCEC